MSSSGQTSCTRYDIIVEEQERLNWFLLQHGDEQSRGGVVPQTETLSRRGADLQSFSFLAECELTRTKDLAAVEDSDTMPLP